MTTKIGTRVIITHDDVAPIEIARPRLFTSQPEMERAPVAVQEQNAGSPDVSATT